MLTPQDKLAAETVLKMMVKQAKDGLISHEAFEREMKQYFQDLIDEYDLEVSEIKPLAESAGIDLDVNVSNED